MEPSEIERRAHELLRQALELPDSEHADFLAGVRAGEAPEVADRVGELLGAHASADSFFDRLGRLAGVGAGGEPGPDPKVDLSGRHVGKYELVELLGRGGMGAVYRAERIAGDFEHVVALKLLPLGMDTPEARRRFEGERRHLARLSHPGIARLLDGGVSEDGTPYFVLEFVKGRHLTDFCDSSRASLRERIVLFRKACGAVQHAHQSLIVHRDLKPSNMLVTSTGDVKLLDFGISRVLDAESELGAAIADPTRYLRVLTPGYASPEQIRGEPVATSSDVFSLGVVLHELLTGTLPYSLDPGAATAEFASGIPPRPAVRFASIASTQQTVAEQRSTNPAQLAKTLRTDLAAIVMRAIDPAPERRYASVADLDRDLGRWLRSEPVEARRPTLPYIARKYAHRHRGALAVAAVIAMLFAALGVSRVQEARRVAQAQERTALEAAKTAAFAEVIQSANPLGDGRRDVTVEEALSWALASLPSRQYPPAVDAAVRTAIGVTLFNLARYEEAEPLFRESLAQREALLTSPDPDIAESQFWMGEIHSILRSDSAAWYHLRALEMRRATLAPTASEIVESMVALSDHLPGRAEDPPPPLVPELAGMTPESLLDGARALEVAGAASAARLEDIDVRRSGLAQERGDLADAEALALDVLERRKARLGDSHPLTAEILHTLGGIRAERGDHAGAVDALRRVYEIDTQTLGDHERVGSVELSLGVSLAALGDTAEALEYDRRALATYQTVLGPDDLYVGLALQHIGSLLVASGRYDEAVPELRRAWEIYAGLYGADRWEAAGARGWYGHALGRSGHRAEGIRELEAAVGVLDSQLGSDHERTVAMRSRLEALRGS